MPTHIRRHRCLQWDRRYRRHLHNIMWVQYMDPMATKGTVP